MGLLLGLGLIGAAFAMDIPKQAKYNRRKAILDAHSNPASLEHILYVKNHKMDDEGNRVIDYIRQHEGRDSNGVYHNCFIEEAVFNLAREQCRRHGIEIGMEEAWYECRCPEVNRFFESRGF